MNFFLFLSYMALLVRVKETWLAFLQSVNVCNCSSGCNNFVFVLLLHSSCLVVYHPPVAGVKSFCYRLYIVIYSIFRFFTRLSVLTIWAFTIIFFVALGCISRL